MKKTPVTGAPSGPKRAAGGQATAALGSIGAAAVTVSVFLDDGRAIISDLPTSTSTAPEHVEAIGHVVATDSPFIAATGDADTDDAA